MLWDFSFRKLLNYKNSKFLLRNIPYFTHEDNFFSFNLYRCETFPSILISLDYINDSSDHTPRLLECFQRVRTPTRSRGTRRRVVTLYLRQRRYCPRLCLSMPTDRFLIVQHNRPIVTVTICARHDFPCDFTPRDTTMSRFFTPRDTFNFTV